MKARSLVTLTLTSVLLTLGSGCAAQTDSADEAAVESGLTSITDFRWIGTVEGKELTIKHLPGYQGSPAFLGFAFTPVAGWKAHARLKTYGRFSGLWILNEQRRVIASTEGTPDHLRSGQQNPWFSNSISLSASLPAGARGQYFFVMRAPDGGWGTVEELELMVVDPAPRPPPDDDCGPGPFDPRDPCSGH